MLVSSLLVLDLASFVAPLNLQVLLKSIYAPTLFGMYSKDVGLIYCQLYGVAGVSTPINTPDCQISAQKVKEMRHYAMQYTRNKLFLEQQYQIGYLDGWCFLQNGGQVFNAQIVRDGYAVVQNLETSSAAEVFRADLELLENNARSEKRGLWKEWEKEMACLKGALKQLQSDLVDKGVLKRTPTQ